MSARHARSPSCQGVLAIGIRNCRKMSMETVGLQATLSAVKTIAMGETSINRFRPNASISPPTWMLYKRAGGRGGGGGVS